MKKMILYVAVLLPAMVFGQGLNKVNYDQSGNIKNTYIGTDEGNYSFTKYYENGEKASIGRFKNGLKHGTWKTWNEKGELTAIAHYKNGEKTGKWVINESDHTSFEISFNHNHLVHALKKDDQGHVVAKR